METTVELPDQLVHLIIRFASSIPDLSLTVGSPSTITTLSLKQLIRSHLSPNEACARIRLIYAGKVLPDSAPLSGSLRLPAPQRPVETHNGNGLASRSKGKQPVPGPSLEAKNYYIHCSLGDALSPSELSEEATLARTTEASLKSQLVTSASARHAGSGSADDDDGTRRRRGRRNNSTTAAPADPSPQGFDRLLSAGFTAEEVADLRMRFQQNLSYTHTPDTMPSSLAEIRALEDRWLDSGVGDGSAALMGEGDGGWGEGFAVSDGGLDDMLWGYLTGFFWPLGALVWGFREEGVWSRRRQLAVAMGVVLNAVFGFMKWSQ